MHVLAVRYLRNLFLESDEGSTWEARVWSLQVRTKGGFAPRWRQNQSQADTRQHRLAVQCWTRPHYVPLFWIKLRLCKNCALKDGKVKGASENVWPISRVVFTFDFWTHSYESINVETPQVKDKVYVIFKLVIRKKLLD